MRPWMVTLFRHAARAALGLAMLEFLVHFWQICAWGVMSELWKPAATRWDAPPFYIATGAIECTLYGVIVVAIATFAVRELHAAILHRPPHPAGSTRPVALCLASIVVLVGLVWLRIAAYGLAGGLR